MLIEFIKEALSGVIAGGIFIFFYNLLEMELLISLGISVGVFIGLYLLIPRSQIEWQLEKMGINTEFVKKSLKEGEMKLQEIRKLSKAIDDSEVEGVVDALEILFANLRKFPARVRSVSKVFSIFLDMTINVFREYAELYDEKISDTKRQETLQKTKDIFKQLEGLFREANEKILSQNFSSLETEVNLLDKIIKNEGV